MRSELQTALMAAQELPEDELPRLLGELEEIRCTATLRLGVSQDYLYRHHRDFPFTRRIGRRLLFSALGIEKYIRQHKCSDSNTAHT